MLKDIGTVISQDGIKVRVGFQMEDFCSPHQIYVRRLQGPWHKVKGLKTQNSEAAREAVEGLGVKNILNL